ncbi:hypothetical protein [Hymenobacter crusticola]|uniref:Uncharacterized protein n=1 Tax=Hymenobacter crusticola TaxID=1770526 RepID=A0A243W6I9_9BACT|nr:hypothetical protein [Hymenobacter crusticola]OUJ70037.1 hypothetical protein BXP70_25535 [Hymenobacter crusticola]
MWELEGQKNGALVLVTRALDVQARVPLTAELARFCAPFEPAEVVRLADPLVEWRQWREAGWDVSLTTATKSDLRVYSPKGSRSTIVPFSAEDT